MSKTIKLLSGPVVFLLLLFLLNGPFSFKAAAALGIAAWMALWWIFRPCSIYVTAFVPVAVNSLFDLLPANRILSQYFSEIAVLLLGSDLICQTWTTTKLDQRISVKTLCSIGTSLRNQIFVWFFASAALSVFLPNVVVASIFCPIAVAMLKFVGEEDFGRKSPATPILLAIGWGSGIGGLGSPIGSPANLVGISYLEQLTGTEFMYIGWISRFLPILIVIFIVNLLFLVSMISSFKNLHGTKEEFLKQYRALGTLRKGEKICLYIFILAVVLAFLRPLYADIMPGMKPAYVFLIMGMLMFVLKNEKGEVLLTWKFAESHAMWGIMIMASSGLALGKLITETGAVDQMAHMLSALHFTGGFLTMLIFCAFTAFMSEMSSNTGGASIGIPLIISICTALQINPIPYIFAAMSACSCAYILPVTTRAIPVGFGLDAGIQMKEGVKLSLITMVVNALLCWAAMEYLPFFSYI